LAYCLKSRGLQQFGVRVLIGLPSFGADAAQVLTIEQLNNNYYVDGNLTIEGSLGYKNL